MGKYKKHILYSLYLIAFVAMVVTAYTDTCASAYVNMALTKSASTTFANKKSNKKIIDFVRAYSVPTPDVNRSLAFYMDESGGDMEATAKHFLSNTGMWKKWVPADVAAKVVDSL